MNNKPLKSLALLLRDLLQVKEDVINFGRINHYKDDYDTLAIVIDNLGTSTFLGRQQSFKDEKMIFNQSWRCPVTIDFYGDKSFEISNIFSLLINSQVCYELERKYKIKLYNVSTITNLKNLVGSQYVERYQIELNLLYTTEYKVAILNINEVLIEPLLKSD